MKPARIAPSLLAADFAHLAESVAKVAPLVDMLHIDMMDGHFVPNLAIGFPVIESLRPTTDLIFDCHMMMSNADLFLDSIKSAGGDLVTVHIEAFPDPSALAETARSLDLAFGLVLNPPTPFEAVHPFVELCDLVLVMSVHPGFGGQSFIDSSLGKIEDARKFIDSAALDVDIQVDGGITPETAALARKAGADVFVAGTAVFRDPNPVEALKVLRTSIETAG